MPIEVFRVVQALHERIIPFDFKYHLKARKRSATSFPEAQLMSLVVIIVKLLYPFDWEENTCVTDSINEPAAQKVDWQTWLQACNEIKGRHPRPNGFNQGDEIYITDEDVFKMSPEQMDAYMDWYQRMWAYDEEPRGNNLRRELLHMFPFKDLPPRPSSGNVDQRLEISSEQATKEVQSELRLVQQIGAAKSTDLRPGERYRQFRSVAELNNHQYARAFYEAAAKAACLSLEMMVRAVCETENKILVWRRARRRAEMTGEAMDLDIGFEMGSLVDEVRDQLVVS